MMTCHLCGFEVDDFVGYCTGCMAPITARDLIIGLRGGVPPKCDFCGEEKPPADLHPEEGGEWACINCIERWKAQGEQY